MKNPLIFKSVLFLMLFASTILLLNSCIKGKGGIVEQQITVADDFTGVKAMGEFDVVVVLGSAKTVIAKGNQNIIDRLITNVNNDGILELELEAGDEEGGGDGGAAVAEGESAGEGGRGREGGDEQAEDEAEADDHTYILEDLLLTRPLQYDKSRKIHNTYYDKTSKIQNTY